MSRADLLPSNATALERALSLTTDVGRLAPAAEAIRRFKTDPADALLPYLVWEYGLAELLPYLPDARVAIREGVRWQRLRGTPAALKIALGWIAAGEVAIEQEEPGSAHWAEFQLDPGRWLEWEEIGRILAVASLSAPARSRLARLYHGYDIRRLKLDAGRLDEALLSDYSGVRWRDGIARVSFGRLWQAESACALLPQALLRMAAHGRFARYEDRCLLSVMRLGCKGIPNPAIEHGHAHERREALGIAGLAQLAPERRFARAQIVLSEQWALGATNACTPPRAWVPAEAPMRLGDALSGGIGAGRWVAILERLEAGHGGAASVSVQLGGWTATVQRSARQHADRHRRLSDLRLSAEAPDGWQLGRADVHSLAMQLALPQPESAALGVRGVALRWDGGTAQRGLEFVHPRQAQRLWPVQAQRHVVGVCSALAHYRGQRWSGRWQRRSWRQARECLQSQHFTQE